MELLQPAPPAPWLDDSWSTVEVQPWTGWRDEEAPAPPAFCLRAAFSRSRSMACAFHFRISSTFGEALEKPPYRAMPPEDDTPGGGAGERCAAPYEGV